MTVKYRKRGSQRTLNGYRWFELVTGEVACAVPQWDLDEVHRDWMANRDVIMAWWRTGQSKWKDFCPDARPWLFCCGYPGRRPWAWWEFDAPERMQPDEGELTYLTRLGLLFPGEFEDREAEEAAREAEAAAWETFGVKPVARGRR